MLLGIAFVMLLVINLIQVWATTEVWRCMTSARTSITRHQAGHPPHAHVRPTTERVWVRRTLIGVAVVFLLAVLVLPLALVFSSKRSAKAPLSTSRPGDPQSQAAIRLTAAGGGDRRAAQSGVRRCRCLVRRQIRISGQAFLTTLIDLPFSISPVVSGMVYVLLFSAQSALSPLPSRQTYRDLPLCRAGIVLATIFVTFPFITRELIPLMQNQRC